MALSYSYLVVGATVLGGTWYLSHLARGPHSEPHTSCSQLFFRISEFPNFQRVVIWTKSNPTPWNEVKQDENVKLMAVNQKFDKRYVPLLLLAYWLLVVDITSVSTYDSGVLCSWKRDRL